VTLEPLALIVDHECNIIGALDIGRCSSSRRSGGGDGGSSSSSSSSSSSGSVGRSSSLKSTSVLDGAIRLLPKPAGYVEGASDLQGDDGGMMMTHSCTILYTIHSCTILYTILVPYNYTLYCTHSLYCARSLYCTHTLYR
jgi:hypothetical protein